MTDARDIYQDQIDLVSRALWDGDFDLVASTISYPYTVRFPDKVWFHDASADLIQMKQFRRRLEGLGATGYHRVCERAAYDPLDPSRIEGVHWTYILRGGNYLTDPYTCEMALIHGEAGWLTQSLSMPALRHGIPDAAPLHSISKEVIL